MLYGLKFKGIDGVIMVINIYGSGKVGGKIIVTGTNYFCNAKKKKELD